MLFLMPISYGIAAAAPTKCKVSHGQSRAGPLAAAFWNDPSGWIEAARRYRDGNARVRRVLCAIDTCDPAARQYIVGP